MAAAKAESVEVEMQRAELKAVLGSPEFVRAPKLAQLLSYLCEKLFAGEAGQIKEYSIGVELFNRGASFDQDSDSIVRVEANRLRKRLAEFYAGEGASHAMQIVIPTGQYVPRFELKTRPSAENEVPKETARDVSGDQVRRLKLRWLVAAAAGILVAATAWTIFSLTQARLHRTAESVTVPVQPELPGGQFGPPVGDEVRILAGATRSQVDHAGKLWSADAGFTGGTEVKSGQQHIERTLDPAFYRTSRQGQFRYDIPLKPGAYELRLHFAETVYGPEATGTGGEGSRLMSVRVNGQTVLNGFDVIGDVGASQMADIKVFPDVHPASDGKLHIEFAGEGGKAAMVSAIEILPGLGKLIRPIRVVARQSPYYSNDSHWWSPDNYFEGGQLATYAQEVSGTDDPELYETERWGNFSYALPVTAGRYTLVLHFAARHSNPGEPAGQNPAASSPVPVIFNVFCNGKAILENFNLTQAAQNSDVVIRRFNGLEPNAQGKLMLAFVPVVGHATVAGIEVLPEDRR